MAKKLRIGILFGGRSGEHEVSLLSAASILKAIDRKKFDVVPIGITKTGRWLTGGGAQGLLTGSSAEPDGLTLQASTDLLPPAPADAVTALVPDAASLGSGHLDVVFPVLHGTFGEDGTIQGLFELADTAYVGSGVLGSSPRRGCPSSGT
jgi:D-alanine-D-alanine ligase